MKKAEGNLRSAEKCDVPMLKALWKMVFGDSDPDIARFFSTWFSPELTVVIDDGIQPASAAYILPVGNLVLSNDKRINCAMIYAIATKPKSRRLGYGEAVTKAAARIASQKGFPAIILKPASDGLFEYYLKHTPFEEYFNIFETEYSAAELSSHDKQYTMSPVAPAKYRQLRNNLLQGCIYIDMDERAISHLQYLCASAGGGIYALSHDGKQVGCAAIEQDHSLVRIKELLLDSGCRMTDAVSAAAFLFPAGKYFVRSPSEYHKAQIDTAKRFGMIIPLDGRQGRPSEQTVKWYGPAFD